MKVALQVLGLAGLAAITATRHSHWAEIAIVAILLGTAIWLFK
jgi:hypothetical protein